jgi:cytoskeletal protein CcmA (bactofilin family)
MRILKVFVIVLTILSSTIALCGINFAWAADFLASDSKTELRVSSDQTARNLFAAGETVRIEAKEIAKDLFVAGKTLYIDSRIENNCFVAGETINIQGNIGGNLFALAKTLIIASEIEGDIFALGADIILEKGAYIHGEIYSGSGKLHIKGSVMGDVSASCADAMVEGSVLGSLRLQVENSLHIYSGAIIQELVYSSPTEANIEQGAEVRKKEYTPLVRSDKANRRNRVFGGTKANFGLMNWISSLILAFIFLMLFKKPCQGIVTKIQNQFGMSIAFGLSFMIGAPIAVMLILLTFMGYKVAIVTAVLAIFIWTIASTLGSLLLGVLVRYLISKDRKDFASYLNWVSVLLGVSLYQLLVFIPVLGWLAKVLALMAGIGGLMMYFSGLLSNKVSVGKDSEIVNQANPL